MPDISAILTSLEQVPAILTAFVASVPAARLTERRREGAWTIAEHAVHLAECQPMLAGRISRILAEDDPEIVPFIPDLTPSPAPRMSLDAALALFAAERVGQLALLRAATPEQWRRTARHPEYEAYGLHILARHALVHDHWHLYRMEEIWLLRDAFLPA